MLTENRGRVVAKDELLGTIWPNTTVEEANLAQAISTLCKVLDDSPKQHRRLRLGVAKPSKSASHSRFFPISFSASYLIAAAFAVLLIGIAGYLLARKSSQRSMFYPSVPLTSYLGSEICPSFAPDRERVAFAWEGETQDNFDIYVKQVGGGPPFRLTSDPAPDISPAGRPIGAP
jgi:hypothetical protein